MADLFILFFTIIIGLLVWTKIWKKVVLEFFIDELFDLRDGLKNKFNENNVSDETVVYENLRILLNRHISYIHELSYLDLVRTKRLYRKRKDLRKYMNSVVNSLFESNNKKLNKISKDVRIQASMILNVYIGLTTFHSFFIISIFTTFFLIKEFGKEISQKLSSLLHIFELYKELDNLLTKEGVLLTANKPATRVVGKKLKIETVSFFGGKNGTEKENRQKDLSYAH